MIAMTMMASLSKIFSVVGSKRRKPGLIPLCFRNRMLRKLKNAQNACQCMLHKILSALFTVKMYNVSHNYPNGWKVNNYTVKSC